MVELMSKKEIQMRALADSKELQEAIFFVNKNLFVLLLSRSFLYHRYSLLLLLSRIFLFFTSNNNNNNPFLLLLPLLLCHAAKIIIYPRHTASPNPNDITLHLIGNQVPVELPSLTYDATISISI
jgi:hypothetical protein